MCWVMHIIFEVVGKKGFDNMVSWSTSRQFQVSNLVRKEESRIYRGYKDNNPFWFDKL